jgi:hypothetical protein
MLLVGSIPYHGHVEKEVTIDEKLYGCSATNIHDAFFCSLDEESKKNLCSVEIEIAGLLKTLSATTESVLGFFSLWQDSILTILNHLESEEVKTKIIVKIESKPFMIDWDKETRNELINIVTKWQPILARHARVPLSKYLLKNLTLNPEFLEFVQKYKRIPLICIIANLLTAVVSSLKQLRPKKNSFE